MAEGFRFMLLGFVRLRTFQLLRCNINAGVHARPKSGRVTQRCHNSPDGKRGKQVRMTSRTGSPWRIWGILKKVELRTGQRTRRVDFCLRRPWAGVAQDGGGGGADEKARIERMCISLLMSKNL